MSGRLTALLVAAAVAALGIASSRLWLDRRRQDELRTRELALQEVQALARLVAEISSRLASVPMDKLDDAIEASLANVGALADVDRAYLIVLSADGNRIRDVHEWCAEGIEPQIRNLEDAPAEDFLWGLETLERGQVLHVPHLAQLRHPAGVLSKMIEAGHIQSTLNVPVHWRQRLGGVVGFDAVRQSKAWDEQEVALLQTIAEIFAGVLGRRESEDEHRRALAALAEQRERLEQRVNDRTTELLKANERLFEQIKEREDVAEQLMHRVDENRRLTQTLIALQEQDGRALSQELHDELAQSLTAIKTDAVLIKRRCAGQHPKMRHSAENIIRISEQVYDRIHELLRRLRPSFVGEMGLVTALKALVASLHLPTLGIQCEERYQGELEDVDERLSITLYRLVQEALTNVVKHAQACHVQIELSRETLSNEADVVRLSVRDDGQGADFGARAFGYGLLGLSERVQALGGTFEVDSAPGRGTIVRATVPVHAMPERDD